MRQRLGTICAICTCALLLWTTTFVGRTRAADIREFAGIYEISNTADLGDQVSLNLTVRLTNYSGSDLNGATATIEDKQEPAAVLGTFPAAVSVSNQRSVRLIGNFTIPKAEYEHWQGGSTPVLWLSVTRG